MPSFSRLFIITGFLLSGVLLSSLLMTGHSMADMPSTVSVDRNYDAIGEYSQYLIEQETPLNIEQVIARHADGGFSDWNKAVLSFDIGSNPVWVRFDVDNTTGQLQHRRVIIENSWLDHVEIFVVYNGAVLLQQQAGDLMPFTQKPVKHRFMAFDTSYPPGTSTVYIRAQTPDPMVLPIYFGDMEASTSRDLFNAYTYGLFYGILIGLLLYNLSIYLSIQQPRYLYYVLYLSMFLLTNLSYTGHGNAFIWTDNVWLQQWLNPTFITAAAVSGIIFAFSFLKIRKYFPQLFFQTTIVCTFICSLQLLFISLGMQTASVATSITFVMMFSVFTVYCGIISFHKGYRDAIYYLVATIATLIGTAITASTVLAIIPYTILSYRAAEISISIDSILLSLALAEQIRRAQKEKIQAQQLARIDMLTGLYNRRAFNEIATPIWHNATRHKQDLCILLLDADKFKRINDNYGHAVGDEVLKVISSELSGSIRDGDVLARWGGEEFAMLLPQTSLEQARMMAERIRQRISFTRIETDKDTINITVSIGVAQKNINTKTMDKLFTAADASLYLAKQSGRNRVCIG